MITPDDVLSPPPLTHRTLGELAVSETVNEMTGGQEVTLTLTGDGFLYRMVG